MILMTAQLGKTSNKSFLGFQYRAVDLKSKVFFSFPVNVFGYNEIILSH